MASVALSSARSTTVVARRSWNIPTHATAFMDNMNPGFFCSALVSGGRLNPKRRQQHAPRWSSSVSRAGLSLAGEQRTLAEPSSRPTWRCSALCRPTRRRPTQRGPQDGGQGPAVFLVLSAREHSGHRRAGPLVYFLLERCSADIVALRAAEKDLLDFDVTEAAESRPR